MSAYASAYQLRRFVRRMAGREISVRALAESLERTEGAIRSWVRHGLFVKVGRRCAEADAIEAAVIDFLIRKNLTHDQVRGIMNGIRAALRVAPANTRLRVIWHRRRHGGSLVVGNDAAADAAVGRAVSTGRTVLVFEIAEDVASMRADFQGAMEACDPTETA